MDISPKANGQKVYEKMFNIITNHQGHTNPNHNEISPHTCEDGYYKKHHHHHQQQQQKQPKHQTNKNNKRWKRCREIGITVYSWWKCNMVQLL